VRRILVRFAAPIALILWGAVGASTSDAVITLAPPPAVPEPAAALVFALGVGVVAWSARRSR